MPATVPLSSPVTSMSSARALTESIALAGTGDAVSPAIDRVLRFLSGLPCSALQISFVGVLDVLHLLGDSRALLATEWLGRWALDAECAHFWYELHELVALGRTV